MLLQNGLNIIIDYKILCFIVNILAITNLLILSLFLITRKHNSLPNYILALIIFLPLNNFTFNLLLIGGVVLKHPQLILLGTSVLNASFPLLLYLYIRLLAKKTLKNKYIYVPWFFILIASLIFQIHFSLLSPEQQLHFVKKFSEGVPPQEFKIVNMIFFIITLTYSILAYITGIKNFNNVKLTGGNTLEFIRAKYVKILSSIILILSVSIIMLYWSIPYQWVDFIVLPIAMIVVFFVIVFSAQKSAIIFSIDDFHLIVSEKKEPINNNKIKKLYPKINIESIELILKQAIEEEFFLDSNVSLSSLAEKYQIPKHYLSAYIHEAYGTNFSDFVNKFRVEYALKLLKDTNSKKFSIEGIGKSSGFNSRASFYRSFKKFTLKSPKEYLIN